MCDSNGIRRTLQSLGVVTTTTAAAPLAITDSIMMTMAMLIIISIGSTSMVTEVRSISSMMIMGMAMSATTTGISAGIH